MEDHTGQTYDDRCQAIIDQIDPTNQEETGETTTFMYYRGVSPFCPSDANEPSRWVINIWRAGFGFYIDPEVKIKCVA